MRVLMVTIALVGLGAFAAACNDDGSDTLTLEEYFAKVDELDDNQGRHSDEIGRELDALGEDASPDAVADSLQKQADFLEDFRADLDDINPPAGGADARERRLEELHHELVRALGGATEQFDELIAEFREAESVDAAFEAFDASFDDASEIGNVHVSCQKLDDIAKEYNIAVDFDCSFATWQSHRGDRLP